jgi:protocatechuate 3,4-dioxygenase beta subunit
VTDEQGRFVLADVVAGHYTVIASRPGYVDTILGAAPGSLFGAPIAVDEGQHVGGLSIRMARGGVITGTVRVPSGQPARGVQVQVNPIRTVDGRRRARFTTALGIATTDDRGIYRHFGLAPGDYVVQVMVGAGPGGAAEAVRLTTPEEIAWAERLDSPRSVAAGQVAVPQPASRVVTYAPIYYPGTTTLETARAISLAAGEERTAIDLVIEYVPVARVSGVVVDPEGRPHAGATVRLNRTGASESLADIMGALVGQSARTDEKGSFAIDHVPPGDYTVSARATRAGEAPAPEAAPTSTNVMTMITSMFGRGGAAGALHASSTINVTGFDVTNVELRLGEGSSVSGTVVFDGAATRPSPDAMQVMLVGVSARTSIVEQALSMVQGASARVSDDLTFAIRGVAPNRYRATVNLPGAFFGTITPTAAWTVKSIHAGSGPDLADVPFDVVPGRNVEGLVVTLTDRPTVVSGKVVDGEGRPFSAFPIIVFSTDSAHWVAGSRRIQQARPASDGSYRISGLPAGRYYVGAVTTLDLEDLYDPSFLQQLVPAALTITLADGETRTQDLKVGG